MRNQSDPACPHRAYERVSIKKPGSTLYGHTVERCLDCGHERAEIMQTPEGPDYMRPYLEKQTDK